MKKTFVLPSIIFLAVVSIITGCNNSKSNLCVVCTASYVGYEVDKKEACTEQDRQDFKSRYYYAEVTCK